MNIDRNKIQNTRTAASKYGSGVCYSWRFCGGPDHHSRIAKRAHRVRFIKNPSFLPGFLLGNLIVAETDGFFNSENTETISKTTIFRPAHPAAAHPDRQTPPFSCRPPGPSARRSGSGSARGTGAGRSERTTGTARGRSHFSKAQPGGIASHKKYGVSAIGVSALERPVKAATDGVLANGNVGMALSTTRKEKGAMAWLPDGKTYNAAGTAGSGEGCIYSLLLTLNFVKIANLEQFGYISTKALNLATGGFLTEWDRIPSVDVSRDYWMTDYFENTTIGGYHFFCPGSTNISAYNTIGVTFFNKQLLALYSDLANSYDLVRSGDWTFEAMREMCGVVSEDLDGGGMGEKGRYGLAVNAFCWQPFFYASGTTMVRKDDQDIPYFAVYQDGVNEVIYNRLSQIVQFVNDKSRALLTNNYNVKDLPTENLESYMFLSYHALFWVEAVYGQYNLRDMRSAYGILPMPVRNVGDPYVSYTHAGHSSVMCVTVKAPDLAFSGAVMEDMAYISERTIIPEFYEQTIRRRGVRDSESYEMPGIIYQTIIIDLAQAMKNAGLILDVGVREQLIDNGSDVASFFTSNRSALTAKLTSLSALFTEQGNRQYAE